MPNHRPLPRNQARARTRARTGRPLALARGVLALAALAALAAGVPMLLLNAGHLPSHVPSPADVTAALSAPDDGTLLMTALTIGAWTAWLWLMLPVIAETGAVLARRTTPRLPGMGTGQRLAGFLLGSILLAAPAATAVAAPMPAASAPHAPHTPAPDADAQAAHTPAAPDTGPRTPPAPAAGPLHTVGGGGSTYWDLAETFLGSGLRHQDIKDLNPELPDGTLLAPGTVVQLPADAAQSRTNGQPESGLVPQLASAPAGSEPEATGGGAPDTYTVQPGDYLSQIAQEELGDANAWPELFDASRGADQPSGLPRISDPDVIHPGQVVTLPTSSPSGGSAGEPGDEGQKPKDPHNPGDDGAVPPAPDTSSDTSPTAGPSQAEPRPSTDTPSSTAPSSPPASTDPGSPGPTPTTEPAEPGESAGAVEPAASSHSIRAVAGAFALLAAAITGALALRRLLQRRRRKPGETIAIADETSTAEAQLAQAAEGSDADRLDAALRTLAHHATDTGRPLPELRTARIGTRSLAVLPADPATPPLPPFTNSGDGDGWWTLPHDAGLLPSDDAQQIPAPYPALVTIGATESGDLILLNLPHHQVLLLAGEPAHVEAALLSLALELGMSPWSTDTEVVVAAFGDGLPQLLPTSRIAHMTQPDHAARDFSQRLLETQQLPDASLHPHVIMCAALDPDAAWQLAESIDRAGALPVALIAPAAGVETYFPHAEVLDVSAPVPQDLEGIGAPVTVQRLEPAAYQQIVTALAVSGEPANPPQGPWRNVPGEEQAPHSPTAPGPGPHSEQQPPAPAEKAEEEAPLEWAPSRPHEQGPEQNSADTNGVFTALMTGSGDPAGIPMPPNIPAPATGAPPGQLFPQESHAPAAEGAEPAAAEPYVPEVRVLGPVEVTGVTMTGHGPRLAQLAALLLLKPGRSSDTICADMDPFSPWSLPTLKSRIRGLRSSLGNDPDGNPYVPRRQSKDDPCTISPRVRCDWTRFTDLAEHALPHGPDGVHQLEDALALVRGRPFGTHPLPWSEPYQQEMITRIVDVAHTVATYRTAPGPHQDLTLARRAVTTGLEADDTSELLYRDYFRIEHAAGNRSALHTAMIRLQKINRTLDCEMEIATEQLLNELLPTNGARSTSRRPPATPQARVTSGHPG
ncbi:LysM peptidoglycan-binding domain-containing protein [Streptomyces niveus]|uniref:LysM peptidoglycan-binding domain-containing protein n=1 Tax=Streptomyces niveus TaxID=193462 RepID=UPI0036C2D29D